MYRFYTFTECEILLNSFEIINKLLNSTVQSHNGWLLTNVPSEKVGEEVKILIQNYIINIFDFFFQINYCTKIL